MNLSQISSDQIATTNNPPLTTINQPLRVMGQAAASTLLGLIRDEIPHPRPPTITVYPKLVVRKSTAHASSRTTPLAADADD